MQQNLYGIATKYFNALDKFTLEYLAKLRSSKGSQAKLREQRDKFKAAELLQPLPPAKELKKVVIFRP